MPAQAMLYSHTPIENYHFKSLNAEKLDVIGGQWRTVEDKHGFIWFGGSGGLARYDGYEIKLYRHKPEDKYSLSSSYVTDMLIDEKQQLWISTLEGINLYDEDKDNFIRYNHDNNKPTGLSHKWVWDMDLDDEGNIWLATDGGGINKFSPATKKFKHFKHIPGNKNSLSSDANLKVIRDSEGMVWAGSKFKGVVRFDPINQKFTRYNFNKGNNKSLSNHNILALYEDKQKQVWVGTREGLNRFDTRTKRFTRYTHKENDSTSISNNIIRDIREDKHGNLWIATDGGGLCIYNYEKDNFTRFSRDETEIDGLVNNKIRSIFEDSSGQLWFGHYPSGVSLLDNYASAFFNYQRKPQNKYNLSNSDILAVDEDKKGNLWVGTEKGLNFINRKTGRIKQYLHSHSDNTSLPADAVISVLVDSYNEVWVGTWGGGIARFNRQTGNFHRYLKENNKTHEQLIASGATYTDLQAYQGRILYEDKNRTLWIGHEFGLSQYKRSKNKFKHYSHDSNDYTSILELGVNAILEDSKNNFWVGVDSGLALMNRETGKFKRYINDNINPYSISQGYITSIAEDAEQQLWIATGTNGVNYFDEKKQHFNKLNVSDGLADSRVGCILDDGQGDIWFATGRGLSRYNKQTKKFQTYSKEHGLAGSLYKRHNCLKTKNDELIFGSSKGLSLFKSENLAKNTQVPPVAITQFNLFNKAVSINDKNSRLEKPIHLSKVLNLNHQDSVFSIQFSALSYQMPGQNQYAYMLDGFDNDWVYSGTQRMATYTNLDPGQYIFKVKASNNEGVWNDEGQSLIINILPPLWLTPWAYALYAFIGLLILFLFMRSQGKKVRDAQEKLALRETVVTRLEHLDKLKDDFLANTSHELRTPLNGIIGITDSLMGGAAGKISPEMQNNLNMISASGKRLAHLVNDILDFSKLKNKQMTLHIKSIDVYQLADLVMKISQPSIGSKTITLENKIDPQIATVFADEDRLQQVFFNLIGNAIKFTNDGNIRLSATKQGDKVWIKVSDTGIGIAKEKLDNIFDSFAQIEEHNTRSQGGTGLGLTITKKIIELHEGNLKVNSEPNIGSTFSFSLPISGQEAENNLSSQTLDAVSKAANFDGPEFQEKEDLSLPATQYASKIKVQNLPQSHLENNLSKPKKAQKPSKFKILIVDDDAVNRQVLTNQLKEEKNYILEEASNGPKALELIDKYGPYDLVLLDIMMPMMSGFEVCKEVRKTYNIQEMPIIFLTAKNLIIDLADGFEVGANDFLTKPISLGELSSRVRTHLQLLDMNKNLERKVSQRTEEVTLAYTELKTLDNIVSTIHQELRFDRLLKVILHEAMILFPTADRAAYWNLDKEESAFKLTSTHNIVNFDNNLDTSETTEYETLSSEDIYKTYLNDESKLFDHIYLIDIQRLSKDAVYGTDLNSSRSALAIAMELDGEIVGVLVLASNRSSKTFISSKASTLHRFRSHVTSALTKSNLMNLLESQCTELENISVTDPLTGLGNRRFLYKHLDADIEKVLASHLSSSEQKTEASLATNQDFIFFILDIDHFKSINDTYGHVAGDKILTDMGMILNKLFRDTDYYIRWGGEEFVVIARFCNREKGPEMAEKIRSRISEFDFKISEELSIPTTCSIGFASYPFQLALPDHNNWENVLDVADTCLYAAKKSNRNAWVGLYADDNPDPNLVNKILDDVENTYTDKDIKIKTSFEGSKPLIWK